MSKGVSVFTNDPARSRFDLTVTGNVTRFALVTPSRVSFMGSLGQPFVKKVEILPTESHPFAITQVKAEKGGEDFRFELEKNNAGYVLTVTVTRRTPGRFYDNIHLMTDSRVKPEIIVPVFGNLFQGAKP